MIVQHTTCLNHGGTENNAVLLLKSLNAMGIPTALVVDRPPYEELGDLQHLGLDVRTLNTSKHTSGLEFRAKFRSTLASLRATLVHSHIWERHLESYSEAQNLGIKVVTTIHTTVQGTMRHRLGLTRDPARFGTFRRAFRLTDPITINISDLSEAGFRRILPTVSLTRCVHCGVAIPDSISSPEDCGNSPLVLWVGSMIPRKRPLLALRAWRRVLQAFPEAKLTMIGDGPQRTKVELAASSLPGVKFPGIVKPWQEIAGKSQIYFHTGVHEGLPMTVLEAMASGLPIVSTSSGATREAVTNGVNGLLVREDDPRAAARALIELISKPGLRKRLGTESRKMCVARFSAEHHVSNVLRVYRELAGLEVNMRGTPHRCPAPRLEGVAGVST
jgi:glycosyltransferase involved in cell wall biosynthesis